MDVARPPTTLAALPEVIANGGRVPNYYLNPSWISLKHDLLIPDDATITGTGSASPTDSGYGTQNLAAASTGIGARPAETVTQRIQAALNLGSNGPLGLLWDVRCSVGATASSTSTFLNALTLRRPGNLHIMGRPGCGAILRAQSNVPIFGNELPTFGTPVSAIGTNQQINQIGGIAFGNVVFENLYLNANSGATGGSSAVNQLLPWNSQNYYLNVMRLYGVQDISFLGCTVVGFGGFGLYFGNWQRINVERCIIDSLNAGNGNGGNDCLHMNGPGDVCTVRDTTLDCEDDHYALNTADGTNAALGAGETVPAWGPITRCRGFNIRANRSSTFANFINVMSCGGIVTGGHEFDGIYGSNLRLMRLDNSQVSGAGGGTIGTVEIRNVDADLSAVGILIGQSLAPASIARLNVKGVRRSGSHLTVPLVTVNGPVVHLDIDDLYVYDDTTSGSAKQQVEVTSAGSIARFSARGVRLESANAGQATMPLLQIDSGGSVALATLAGITSDHVLDIATNAGTITKLLGSGISQSNVGSGAIVANAGTWTTSVLSNVDPATLDHTGTAPGATHGDYY
jgi:hypothetical protein